MSGFSIDKAQETAENVLKPSPHVESIAGQLRDLERQLIGIEKELGDAQSVAQQMRRLEEVKGSILSTLYKSPEEGGGVLPTYTILKTYSDSLQEIVGSEEADPRLKEYALYRLGELFGIESIFIRPAMENAMANTAYREKSAEQSITNLTAGLEITRNAKGILAELYKNFSELQESHKTYAG